MLRYYFTSCLTLNIKSESHESVVQLTTKNLVLENLLRKQKEMVSVRSSPPAPLRFEERMVYGNHSPGARSLY